MVKVMPSAGYSTTPLAHKLGIKEASRVVLLSAPEEFKLMVRRELRGPSSG